MLPMIRATFATCLLGGSLLSGTAVAAELQTPAASACKSALPAFDGQIRTRPLAMQNEGTMPAFVTCTQQYSLSDPYPRLTSVALLNTTDAAVSVNCTLVTGLPNAPTYESKSITVPASSTQTFLSFSPPGGATQFALPLQSMSCNLPPGIGINRFTTIQANPPA